MNKYILLGLFIALTSLSGCFQHDEDAALRSTPVTNNPNIIPKTPGSNTPNF